MSVPGGLSKSPIPGASASSKDDRTKVRTLCTMASSTERTCSTFAPSEAISSISSNEILATRPALPRSGMHAHILQGDCQKAGGDLFAGSDDGVIFARVVHRRGFARPLDGFVGLAGHGRDYHRGLMAGIDLALDMARHIADAG